MFGFLRPWDPSHSILPSFSLVGDDRLHGVDQPKRLHKHRVAQLGVAFVPADGSQLVQKVRQCPDLSVVDLEIQLSCSLTHVLSKLAPVQFAVALLVRGVSLLLLLQIRFHSHPPSRDEHARRRGGQARACELVPHTVDVVVLVPAVVFVDIVVGARACALVRDTVVAIGDGGFDVCAFV